MVCKFCNNERPLSLSEYLLVLYEPEFNSHGYCFSTSFFRQSGFTLHICWNFKGRIHFYIFGWLVFCSLESTAWSSERSLGITLHHHHQWRKLTDNASSSHHQQMFYIGLDRKHTGPSQFEGAEIYCPNFETYYTNCRKHAGAGCEEDWLQMSFVSSGLPRIVGSQGWILSFVTSCSRDAILGEGCKKLLFM